MMHRISCFLIAAMIVGFAADVAPAQIGRGRILKKLRDDIFGSPEQKAREEAARRAAAQKKKVEAQKKAQLEAQRRLQNSRQPTPVNRAQPRRNSQPSRNVQPTPAQRNGQSGFAQQVRQNAERVQSQSALAAPRPNSNRASTTKPTTNRKGFGFEITEKNDKLIVSKIQKNGNAAEAGIRRGDQIVGIGGVEVETKDSFDEIAEILNQGDTIEIAYKRSGQVNDVQIGFGNIPEDDDPSQFTRNENTGSSNSATSRRNDFAPPRNAPSTTGSSVLGQNDTMIREIDRLNQTVSEQRRVIEQLRTQVRALQQTSAPQPSKTRTPRQSQSVLQGPSLNPNR